MIIGRGGVVVLLYVVSFFLFGLRPLFLSIFLLGGGGGGILVFFCLLDLLANFSGGFFRSRAARTDVMFRNLLPKEVFTGLFSLLHCLQFDEECLVYIRFFAAGNCSSSLCEGQRMTMNITLVFFFLFIYTITIPTIPRLKSKKKQGNKY